MKIVSKEYKVYNFDELSENVKGKLIEKERESQLELYCDCYLDDDMCSKASDLLNDYFGITSDYLKTYYDLSYSQGSGAMVEFNINIVDINNKYKVFSDEEIRFLKDKDIVDTIKIRHNNSMYYHEYSFTIDDDYYNYWNYDEIKDEYNITESDFNTIEDRYYNLIVDGNKHYTESPFVKDIISINNELTKYGYGCLEYFGKCSDDEIISFIKDNENEYLENGEIFDGE